MEFIGYLDYGGPARYENYWKYSFKSISYRRSDGWHFTNNDRYTVKYGYQVERVYPDRERIPPVYGPSVTPLKAFCWKVCCPHLRWNIFLWQLLTRCITVKKKLRSREMHRDKICNRCRAPEKSINHVFFECPLTIKSGHLHESQRVQIYFPFNHCLRIWIIYLESFPENGKSSFCMDFMVYM